ncbi:MAG: bacillithiol biosynthesis deacetylase BshB1 [Ignavibacteriales bacterium]|jgi:Uncharacterized proteins, LmbE homologs|nr:MAG: bacillithiol biosynthesis deacetylase BshB1 [Ignavibacteriaceae bacterium]MBW7872555.1 bacillithiol biosynthesis deacetylase BshB1 [Ignavibacteria bacterium]MCZ2141892.1 bacillithiol biosynthesis deacetylase BshB1 [Ignavibacteriales bacterium]OQY74613.1 MAG: bacillithiol biosynthesis deacetylase BshB1 [Ignavibacteriales bacterium UTCHB3]MBV6445059.1 N-acetyl-alpha-D-glucosaminyl L-malate deacetylase 1 [Ignavibacteriaceae bacterium]
MKVDALIFAAHPDDAELGMGGTIAKMTANGLKVGIIDLTAGELGTRGSAEIRKHEAINASVVLKIAARENFHLPDGDVTPIRENYMKLVHAIRKYRPNVIFAPYFNDRHPDHIEASHLAKKAYFFSGVGKVITYENKKPQVPYRPQALYYFMQTYEFEPSFIVDISDYFAQKMEAMKAFSSQFYDPKSKEPETFISQKGFMEFIEARARVYGFRIGKTYGEGFLTEEAVEYDIVHAIRTRTKTTPFA